MINSDTVIPTKGRDLTSIPLGVTLMLRVSFHDATGEQFDATNSKINFLSNRLDLLQVAHGNVNNSIVAKATISGDTVLKVCDGPFINEVRNESPIATISICFLPFHCKVKALP